MTNLTLVNKEVVQLLDALDWLSSVGWQLSEQQALTEALCHQLLLLTECWWTVGYWVLKSLQMQRSTWLQFHMEMCVINLLVSVR